MTHLIACRIASYGKFQDAAWSHLPEIGIHNVEIPVPKPEEYDALRKKLAQHGLTATSFQARCDIAQPDAVEVMRPQLEACAAFAVRICFVSMKAGDTERAIVWDRMRGIGDAAAALNVTVAVETHPDLITNGDVGRQTMEAVNHPNIRVNYDTANIYFYNENVTAEGELAKLIQYVGAVHLKDTNGGFKAWHFPALGAGVVNFPAVFAMLDDRGFRGPYTMELEGIQGVELDQAGQLQYVADSVAFLRKISVL